MGSCLRESLHKTDPLRLRSENQFPLNFAHEYIPVFWFLEVIHNKFSSVMKTIL